MHTKSESSVIDRKRFVMERFERFREAKISEKFVACSEKMRLNVFEGCDMVGNDIKGSR
jgi:hypothetical protein